MNAAPACIAPAAKLRALRCRCAAGPALAIAKRLSAQAFLLPLDPKPRSDGCIEVRALLSARKAMADCLPEAFNKQRWFSGASRPGLIEVAAIGSVACLAGRGFPGPRAPASLKLDTLDDRLDGLLVVFRGLAPRPH